MAYEPNVWKCGDTITADQLNRLEQAVAELSQGGGESGVLVLRGKEDAPGDTDRTWQEVYDAVQQGKLVVYEEIEVGETSAQTGTMWNYFKGIREFVVLFIDSATQGTYRFTAESADDYLTLDK